MASDGGALSVAPGVTIFGTGSQTSVSSGFPSCAGGAPRCCASAAIAVPVNITKISNFKNGSRMETMIAWLCGSPRANRDLVGVLRVQVDQGDEHASLIR